MFRKLTGIFILLCFLLIKNSPLFIFDTFKQPVLLFGLSTLPGQAESEQKANELPEESKGSKHFECADEDFAHSLLMNFTPVLPSAKRIDVHYVKQTTSAYFSLPHPPPDGLS